MLDINTDIIAVNYLAILACSIVSMIVGGLWYSPILFGNIWMKLVGFDKKSIEKAKKSMIGSYFVMFIGALIMNLILAFLINVSNATTWVEGAFLGFVLWIGFIATTFIGSFAFEKKPFKLYLINVFQFMIVLILNGLILAIWQ